MATLIKPNGEKTTTGIPIEGVVPFSDGVICTLLGGVSGYLELGQQHIPEMYLLVPNNQQEQEYNPVASRMFHFTIKGPALLLTPEEYDPIAEEEAKKEKCVHPFSSLKFTDGFVSCSNCGAEDLQRTEQ